MEKIDVLFDCSFQRPNPSSPELIHNTLFVRHYLSRERQHTALTDLSYSLIMTV